MSKQVKMVAQEEKMMICKQGLQQRKQEWKEILNGTPKDRKTHMNVGVLSQTKYGTNRNYEISDTQNKFHSL